jgi:hypothetical protein
MQQQNFWIDVIVGDRQTSVDMGPEDKNTGFDMVIRLRENEGISDKEVRVQGIVLGDELFVRVRATGHESISVHSNRCGE